MKRNFKLSRPIITLLLVLILQSAESIHALGQTYETKKPNIVLILMDDMGYGDVEAYGGIDYKTPHIDKLASQGMRLTNFYAVQPICTASRAGLMTGTYPNRIGVTIAL